MTPDWQTGAAADSRRRVAACFWAICTVVLVPAGFAAPPQPAGAARNACQGQVVLPVTVPDALSEYQSVWTETLRLGWSRRSNVSPASQADVARMQAAAQIAFLSEPEAQRYFVRHFGFAQALSAEVRRIAPQRIEVSVALHVGCSTEQLQTARHEVAQPEDVPTALKQLMENLVPSAETAEPPATTFGAAAAPALGLLISAWSGAAVPLTGFSDSLRHYMRIGQETLSLFGAHQKSFLPSATGGIRLSLALLHGWLDVGLDLSFSSLLLEQYVRKGRLATWISVLPQIAFRWRPARNVPLWIETEMALGLAVLIAGDDSDCHARDLEQTIFHGDLQSRCSGTAHAKTLYDLQLRPTVALRWAVWQGLELRLDVVSFDILTGIGPGPHLDQTLFQVHRDPQPGAAAASAVRLHSSTALGVQAFFSPRLQAGWRF